MNNYTLIECNNIESINKMMDGDAFTWPLLEESGAEIHFINDIYFLFEIPQYGGEPRYVNHFYKHQVDIMVRTIKSWT